MALYGAPVWADSLKRQEISLLCKAQGAMAVRLIRGYRTISREAACVLAGSLPWDLEARALAAVYRWRKEALSRGDLPAPRELEAQRDAARLVMVARWKERLAQPSAGLRTIQAVRPVLEQWLDRSHGALTFRLTQVLSDHGCFGRFLRRIRREESARCHHCDSCPEERAQHTLEECPAWDGERRTLCATVGHDLSLPTIIRSIVGSDRAWRAVLAFCETVMEVKEAAERQREATSEDPGRQRRVGRRRRAYARNIPP
jgi:hypothetical protein